MDEREEKAVSAIRTIDFHGRLNHADMVNIARAVMAMADAELAEARAAAKEHAYEAGTARAEAEELRTEIERLRALPERWFDASGEWYYEHRFDKRGIDYAAGFEEGWDHAANLLHAVLSSAASGRPGASGRGSGG